MKSELSTRMRREAKPVRRAFRRATAPARTLPDYVVIGGQRCGTTSVFRYLVRHPSIAPASEKEIHFFDLNYSRGLNWYRAHFPLSAQVRYAVRRGEKIVTGEATPYYLFHPHVPGRVRRHLPHARLIALLRDPVERAYSHYRNEVDYGHESLTFEEAIERESERVGPELERMLADEEYVSYAHRHFSYLSRGLYCEQLVRWFSLFPREQMLIVRSEDLFTKTAEVVDDVARFLGLEPYPTGEYRQWNAQQAGDLRPETRRRLVDYFAEPNRRLYELLGTDFGWQR